MSDILVDDLLSITADIVSAHISFNKLAAEELPALIAGVHAALSKLGSGSAPVAAQPPEPAVPISASVRADHIICLEDGVKLQTLKRHLTSHHGLTPEEYRKRWQLPSDYPMVAPKYAERRRGIALVSGLGRRRDTAAEAGAAQPQISQEAEVTVPSLPAAEDPSPAPKPDADQAQPKRRTLSAKFKAPDPLPDEASLSPQDLLCRSIARRTCVEATYNKLRVVLAPHIVFTRHDEPFVRAITMEREGKRPSVVKVGTFRLTGLVDLRATTKPFTPNALFEPNDAEYEGTTVCII